MKPNIYQYCRAFSLGYHITNKMLQVAEGSTLGQRVYTWLFSTFFIPSNKKSIYRANAAHFGMFCALTESKISGA